MSCRISPSWKSPLCLLAHCALQFLSFPPSLSLTMAVELFATDFCPFAQRAWIAFLEKVSRESQQL